MDEPEGEGEYSNIRDKASAIILSTPRKWRGTNLKAERRTAQRAKLMVLRGRAKHQLKVLGLPPVQFLAGLYWNSIHCPGSCGKGAWTLFCPALS